MTMAWAFTVPTAYRWQKSGELLSIKMDMPTAMNWIAMGYRFLILTGQRSASCIGWQSCWKTGVLIYDLHNIQIAALSSAALRTKVFPAGGLITQYFLCIPFFAFCNFIACKLNPFKCLPAFQDELLAKAQSALGRMLDFAVYSLQYDISEFFDLFLSSGVATRFDSNSAAVPFTSLFRSSPPPRSTGFLPALPDIRLVLY